MRCSLSGLSPGRGANWPLFLKNFSIIFPADDDSGLKQSGFDEFDFASEGLPRKRRSSGNFRNGAIGYQKAADDLRIGGKTVDDTADAKDLFLPPVFLRCCLILHLKHPDFAVIGGIVRVFGIADGINGYCIGQIRGRVRRTLLLLAL